MTQDHEAPERAGQTPRWVKASLIVAAVLAALLVVAMIIGHGPGRHTKHSMPASHATSLEQLGLPGP